MINPWFIVAALVAFGFVGGASYIRGREDGSNAVIARQTRDEEVRLQTLQAAQEGAAEAIATITVVHTTIRQKAETVIRDVPIYRDCVNDPAVVGLLDAARSNSSSAGVSAGDSELSRAGSDPASIVR